MPIGRPPLQKLRSATKTNPSHQTSSIIAPGAFGSNATLCGDTADRFRRYRCSSRPIRAAFPSPNPAARITRTYKLRLQPAETLGAWTARGFFSVAVKTFSLRSQILPECVTKWPHCSFIRVPAAVDGTGDIAID
jgi:hypothetical protein